MTNDEQQMIKMAWECKYAKEFDPRLSKLQEMVLEHLAEQCATHTRYLLNAHDRHILYHIARKLTQIEKYQDDQAFWDSWNTIQHY